MKESLLAIDGGEPVRSAAMPSWPHFDDDEVEAASVVLRSGQVNYWNGDQGKILEREFADFVGCRQALLLANGTLALQTALSALGIGPGDEVIVPCRTFIASAGSVFAVGAIPVVVDVDPKSQNLTRETILPWLTPKTRAIMAVHLAGWPCEMDELMDLADEHNLFVIEDCAQAHGATLNGRRVGGLGHAGVFSFCQDKIMTFGGEGGMLTTNHEQVWKKAWSLRDHGKDQDLVLAEKPDPGYRWVHSSFGSNYRLTEMQAAIGRIQLRKLPEWLEIRNRHASFLRNTLRDLDCLQIFVPPEHVGHAYYKFYIFLKLGMLAPGWDRQRVMRAISAEGIPVFTGCCSQIQLEKAFEQFPEIHKRSFANAKNLGDTSLMFQIHPTLKGEDLEHIGEAVKKVLAGARK